MSGLPRVSKGPKHAQVYDTQRVHVGIWYILRAQRGSHMPTPRPKYIPYSYMDPLGHICVLLPGNEVTQGEGVSGQLVLPKYPMEGPCT